MIDFKKVWHAYSEHLNNFIATKVPEQEVPDILQNVSIELFNCIEKGTEIRSYKSWLFQVTRNTIADYYKSKSIDSTANFTSVSQEDFKPCVCDIMEQIIATVLPKKYSEPLILSDIHKVPQKEIADKLDVTYENAKSRIQRARIKIKEAFEHSVNFTYGTNGQIVGGVLKNNNNLSVELIEKIKNLQLET